MHIIRLTILYGLCLMIQPAAAQNPAASGAVDCNAEDVMDRLEKSYREHGPITFTFYQQTISSVFDDERTQEGQAWLDASGRFRVEVGGETFVCNADTLWHHVPAYNQVTVRILDSAGRAGLPTDFLWGLRRDFFPVDCRNDTLDKKVLLKVRAVAKTPTAAIQRLTMWIDPRRFLVERAAYVDYNDDRVNLRFSHVKKDDEDAARRFFLNVPDSVEVVTLPPKKLQQNPTVPR